MLKTFSNSTHMSFPFCSKRRSRVPWSSPVTLASIRCPISSSTRACRMASCSTSCAWARPVSASQLSWIRCSTRVLTRHRHRTRCPRSSWRHRPMSCRRAVSSWSWRFATRSAMAIKSTRMTRSRRSWTISMVNLRTICRKSWKSSGHCRPITIVAFMFACTSSAQRDTVSSRSISCAWRSSTQKLTSFPSSPKQTPSPRQSYKSLKWVAPSGLSLCVWIISIIIFCLFLTG